MCLSDQENLASLQQQIRESLQRVRCTIDETRELLRQYNANCDVITLELIESAATEEQVV